MSVLDIWEHCMWKRTPWFHFGDVMWKSSFLDVNTRSSSHNLSTYLLCLFCSFHSVEQLAGSDLTTLKRTVSRQCFQCLRVACWSGPWPKVEGVAWRWGADATGMKSLQVTFLPLFRDWLIFKQKVPTTMTCWVIYCNQCCFIQKHFKSLNICFPFFFHPLAPIILVSSLQEHLPALKPSVPARGGLRGVQQSSS